MRFKIKSALLASGLIYTVACSSINQSPLVIQTVEKAEHVEVSEESKLLEDVVKQYPSPYVERVIYDPGAYQYMLFNIERIHERVDGKNFWRDFYIEKSGVEADNPAVDAFVKKVESNPEYKQNLRRSIILELIENENYHLRNVGARALKLKDYGVGKKTPIYVFSKTFEPDTLDTKYGVINFPLVSGVKEKYVHETIHAEHNALGIPLSSGQRIGPELYRSTHFAVTDFLGELAAHRQTYERFKSEGTDEYAEFLALERMMLYVMQNAPDIIRWSRDGTFSKPDADLFLVEYGVCLEQEDESRRAFDRLNKKLSVVKGQAMD